MSRMNHHTKRILCELRREVSDLKAELVAAQERIAATEDAAAESERWAQQQRWEAQQDAERANRRASEAQREAESARYRDMERESAVRELERARNWQRITGSPTAQWDIDRAMRRLKNL